MRSAPPAAASDDPRGGGIAGTSRVDGHPAGSRIAGAQVLRRIGAGERADVYLGRIGDDTVALKVLRAPTPRGEAERELAALLAGAGPHVVEVRDVGSAADGSAVLVLEPLRPRHLGVLLADRDDLSAGEAITLLQPIAAAVDRMQRAGVAHGAISPRAVLFRDDGAPVLASFGVARAGLAGHSPAAREAEPALRADVAALRELAAAVLDRVVLDRVVLDRGGLDRGVDDVLALRDLREWVLGHDGSDLPELLAERVFDLGEAEPVRLVGSGTTRVLPGRAMPPVRSVPEQPGPPTGLWRFVPEELRPMLVERLRGVLDTVRTERRRIRRGAVDGRGNGRSERADAHPARPVAGTRAPSGLRERLSTVRRPYWVAAGASAVLLVVASITVSVLESDASPRATAPDPAATGDAAALAPADGPAGSTEDAVDAGEAVPDDAGAASPPDDPHPPDDADDADDPVAAARRLLSLRAECFSTLDAACLDGVGHSGSAVLADDRAALDEGIAAGRVSAPWPDVTTATAVAVTQDLGGAVLLRVDTPERGPASVLMVRTEAGWRIRDIVAGDQMPS